MPVTTQTPVETYRAIKRDVLAESNQVIFEQPTSLIATLKPCVYVVGRSVTMGDATTGSQFFPGQRRFRSDNRMLSVACIELKTFQKVLCCYHSDSEQSLIKLESTTCGFRGGS